MGEPLKNIFNEELINNLVREIQSAYKPFDGLSFSNAVFDDSWETLELKERMDRIAITLRSFLPDEFDEAVDILNSITMNFEGLGHMVFPAFIENFGLDHFEKSVKALELFTPYSSSEFAVRPFIKKYPEKMMKQMVLWSQSENFHVRRLSTEGCRPRLPWAMALPEFKNNPDPIMPILNRLKDDQSEYVRRSVANNLNDISKDNPQVLIDLSAKWLGENLNRDKLVKHACRSLLKQGNSEVLTLFGYSVPDHLILSHFEAQDSVKMEETPSFSFILTSENGPLGKLRLEYAIDFMKKNGKLSRKVFKIGEGDYQVHSKSFNRKYSFRSITTRVYYPGLHKLAILVNGVELAIKSFYLNMG